MARDLVIRLIGDSSSLERALKKSSKAVDTFQRKATRSTSKTQRAFGGIGRGLAGTGLGARLGTAGAGLAVTAALKSSYEAASDLEQQVGKTNVVFGESGREVQKWAGTLATSFGISRREALTTASSFGALFAPVGLTGEAAADVSKQLTELGADLASFYNTDVASALEALRSGLVGESEPLRKYGVRLSEVRVQQMALIESGKENVKNLTELEKTHARVTIITKDSALAQGDFSRTSGTAANQTKILQANIANTSATIGGKLVPVVNTAVTELNNLFAAVGRLNSPSGLPKLRTAADVQKYLAEQKALENLPKFPEPFTERGDIDLRERVALAKAKERAKAAAELARAIRARVRAAGEATRQEALDRAQFLVDKTQLTKTLADDLVALRRYNALLERRMKGGHKTLDLEQRQLSVQLQIQDILRQQADAHKKQQAQKKRMGLDKARFQKTARGQFVRAGAHGGGSGVVIHGGVTLTGIHNMQQFERELQKRKRQRAAARRGNRG